MNNGTPPYIHDLSLQSLLAPSIATDPGVAAVAKAIDPVLRNLARQAPSLLLWARLLKTAGVATQESHSPALERATRAAGGLKNLSTAQLEQLAWQLHVDFREAAQNDRQLAGLVVNSIPWHRIKGTPASLKAALELFGYAGVTIEEDGVGRRWASYQLGLQEVADLETVRHIVAVCNEMQPARCKLWRVWSRVYDWRDGAWNVEQWGNAWWSGVSGVEVDIPGIDDAHGLIVSFGKRNRYRTEDCYPAGLLGGAMVSTLGYLAPYLDRPMWNWCSWGEKFPKNHGFVVGELYITSFTTREYRTRTWSGAWDGRRWLEWFSRWGRPVPDWKMRWRATARSQACWASAELPVSCLSCWNSINASYGRPRAVVFRSPAWGEPWGADVERQEMDVPERFRHVRPMTTTPASPGTPRVAVRCFPKP